MVRGEQSTLCIYVKFPIAVYLKCIFLHCSFQICFSATGTSQGTECVFCYFNNQTFTYNEAHQFCANRNSGLAVLDTEPRRQTIRQILPSNVNIYIGLNFFRNNTWLWLDGGVDNRSSDSSK